MYMQNDAQASAVSALFMRAVIVRFIQRVRTRGSWAIARREVIDGFIFR